MENSLFCYGDERRIHTGRQGFYLHVANTLDKLDSTDFTIALTTDRYRNVCVCGVSAGTRQFCSRDCCFLRNIALLSGAEDQQVPESI